MVYTQNYSEVNFINNRKFKIFCNCPG